MLYVWRSLGYGKGYAKIVLFIMPGKSMLRSVRESADLELATVWPFDLSDQTKRLLDSTKREVQCIKNLESGK